MLFIISQRPLRIPLFFQQSKTRRLFITIMIDKEKQQIFIIHFYDFAWKVSKMMHWLSKIIRNIHVRRGRQRQLHSALTLLLNVNLKATNTISMTGHHNMLDHIHDLSLSHDCWLIRPAFTKHQAHHGHGFQCRMASEMPGSHVSQQKQSWAQTDGIMFLLQPTHAKQMHMPSVDNKSVGQCCNSCHAVFCHFPNAAGNDDSLFKNTPEWNIGAKKKTYEPHPAPRFGSSRCTLEECQELRATMNLNKFCDKAQPEAARARKQGSSLPCDGLLHTLQPLSSQKCVSPRSYSWMFEILEMMYSLISDITNCLEACSAQTQDVLIPEQLKTSIASDSHNNRTVTEYQQQVKPDRHHTLVGFR